MQNKTIVIHTLKNYAPSSLNRGEDGAPKSANFADTWRGRISSQAIKRAIRKSDWFEDFRDDNLIGVRTRDLPKLIGGELRGMGWKPGDVDKVVAEFSKIGLKGKEEKGDSGKDTKDVGKTNSIMMIPALAPAAIAAQVAELYESDQWGKVEEVIKPVSMYSVDIALFGAMATTPIFPDVYAACQVSHALSVNRTQKAVDFFTAIDDLAVGNSTKSNMIGDSLFNANCYYHTIAVNWRQLVNNLSGDTALAGRVLKQLIMATATVSPSGKQNTFASHPFADYVMVEVVSGQYWDYANAFAVPVEVPDRTAEQPRAKSLVECAIETMHEYIANTDEMFGRTVNRRIASTVKGVGDCRTLRDLIDAVRYMIDEDAAHA